MQLALTAVLTAGSYVALGLGFGLIFQTTRIFHFAYGALYAVAAYVAAYLANHASLSYVPATVVGVLTAVAVAAVVHLVVYEPLLKRPDAFLALFITSLGVFVILNEALAVIFGRGTVVLPDSIRNAHILRFAGVTVTETRLIIFGLEVAAVIVVIAILRRTGLGLAIRAVGSHGDLAETLGRNLRGIRLVVMALATGLSAIAAVGSAANVGVVTPAMALKAALVGSVAVFVGGVGTVAGAVLGGVVLAVMETYSAGYLSGTWSDVIVYGALLVIILARPAGLLGRARIGSLD